MSSRTIFLSKLLGLYCLFVSLAMLAHKQATLNTVNLAVRDAPLMLILGVFALAIGLAILLVHNVWSGGALPIIITLVGWITLIKGLIFLFLSPAGLATYVQLLHYAQFFYLFIGVDLILGIYLTSAGFAAASG
jgi:hypothetical protein